MSETPEIISFYSYKGGTGRSLAVVHVADYLSSFGKSVLAIDMDLEAPGLHYKLSLVSDEPPVRQTGLVDLMHSVLVLGDAFPSTLTSFSTNVIERDNGAWIRVLPAGDVRRREYWSRLARLNWHDLFYSDGAKGVPFFLELVTRAATEFRPDYILVDSRTGITELGGIASAILPDKFVCIFTNSIESLEGTREVLRSLRTARRLPGKRRLELFPVLARIPETTDSETEESVKAEALRFLNEPAETLGETLDLQDITVLHSEPYLQLHERVLTRPPLVGADELPLMRDYLRLFAQLIPRSVVEPHITNLVNRALTRIMDDPDSVEKDLEAIVNLYPHEESYRALLRFYRLRRASSDSVLRAAHRLWRTTGDAADPLLQDAIQTHFPALPPREVRGIGEFAEKVWFASGAKNAKVGLALARIATLPIAAGKVINLKRVLIALLSQSELTEDEAIDAIRLATGNRQAKLVSDWAHRLWNPQRSPRFQAVFAEALMDGGAHEVLTRALENSELDIIRIRSASFPVYARLLTVLGRNEQLETELEDAYQSAASRNDYETLTEIGRAYKVVGLQRIFDSRVREDLPSSTAEIVLDRLRDERVHEPRRLVRSG